MTGNEWKICYFSSIFLRFFVFSKECSIFIIFHFSFSSRFFPSVSWNVWDDHWIHYDFLTTFLEINNDNFFFEQSSKRNSSTEFLWGFGIFVLFVSVFCSYQIFSIYFTLFLLEKKTKNKTNVLKSKSLVFILHRILS